MSGLTMVGEFGGTLAFMAPEQISRFRQAQPSADQYATAATLYNLLTGQFLHDFPEGAHERLRMILEEEPVPIQARRPDVPPQLAAVIHRALAKEPEGRFPDVRALRKALREFGE
jgi:serine/threonine-protein kinase